MRAASCAFRAVSFFLTCSAATLAVAAAAYRPIAISGTAGANVGLGPNIASASFISLDATLSGPTINASGQVAFAGKMLGVTEDIDTGIWSGSAGALSLVAREGSSTASPNVGANIFFDDLQGTYTQRTLLINDSGKVAFSANLIGVGAGINANNKAGIWTNASGTMTAAVRAGSGYSNIGKPFFNNAGKIAFTAKFGSTDPGGIWSNASGPLAPIARAGAGAPGPDLADGKQFDQFFSLSSFNDSNQAVFSALLKGSLTEPYGPASDEGVWVNSGGSNSILQRTLDPMPGAKPSDNARFFFPYFNVGVNRINNIAVTATVFGANIDSTNNTGIWSNTGGTMHVVARAGAVGPGPNLGPNIFFDTFAGPGGLFGAFKTPVLNASGRIVFDANITGTGITTGLHGIWSNLNGQTTPIALVGSDTYGPGSNQTFNTIGNYSLNERGDIAFSATLSGAGVIGNGAGLWVYRDGAINKIVKTGDVIDIDPSPTKQNLQTVSNVGFIASRPEGGKQLALNDHGQVVYSLTFDSGLTGVFTSTLLQLGDFNLDGVVDKLDLPEMLKALTSLSAYRAKYNLSDADVRTIGDINGDYNALTGKGGLTNRDIQPFLNLLQAQGSGSLESVPEPATALLSAFGVIALLANRRRNATRRKSR